MKVFTIFVIFLAFIIIDPLGLVEPAPIPPTATVKSAPAVDAYPGPQTTVAPDAHPASELTRVFPTPPPGLKPTAEGEPCDACGPKRDR